MIDYKFILFLISIFSILYIKKKLNLGTNITLYVKEIYTDDNRYCKDLKKPFSIYLDISDQFVPEYIEIFDAFNFTMIPEYNFYANNLTFTCSIIGPTETMASYIICELIDKFDLDENINYIMEKYDDEKKFSVEFEGEKYDFTIELLSMYFEIGHKNDDYSPLKPKITGSQVINYSIQEEHHIDFIFDTYLKDNELPGIILHDNSMEISLIELNCTKNDTNKLKCNLNNETVPGPIDNYKIYSIYYKNLCGFRENIDDTISVTSGKDL
jgi:hypothetical protein